MNILTRSAKIVRKFPVHASNGLRCFISNDKILIATDEKTGICTMRLNQPPVNILDGDMLEKCVKAVRTAEKTKDVCGIILTSNFNGKVFSAGLNILDMYQQSHNHLVEYWTLVQEWYLSWYGCTKPTVAVINGHAPAGGCAWSLMCDYRVMQTGKTIGLNEVQLGLAVPFFIGQLLVSAIGQRHADLALTQARMYTSEDAHKMGIVDDIDTLENIREKAEKEMSSFMAVPRRAYHLTKYLLRQKYISKLLDVRQDDAKLFADRMILPHTQEVLGGYLESLKNRKKK